MLLQFVMLASLGAACTGCSAPSVTTALAADNPANPDAATTASTPPVDVLSDGAAPQTSIPSTAMHLAAGSMPGMSHPSTADSAMPGMKMAQAAPLSTGQADAVGTVNTVDAAKHSVNVTHQPIKALGWPSMTMDFPVAPSVSLGAVKPGDRITFTLRRADADGNRQVVQLKPIAGSSGSRGNMPAIDRGAMPGMKMPGDPQ